MQNYELMTPNEINDLSKVYTTVQFSTELYQKISALGFESVL